MKEESVSEDSFIRLEKKQQEARVEVHGINRKVSNFTALAWTCIVVGAFVAIAPLFSSVPLGFNGYGDFFGGTVAAIWSLGGILLIYVAFLGQKQQLINQQVELMHNQIELKATRVELEGQKQQMVEQNKLFRLQRFENTFFNLLSNFNKIVSEIEYREGRVVTTSEKTPKEHIGMGMSLDRIASTSDRLESSKVIDSTVVDIYKGKSALEKIINELEGKYFKALHNREDGKSEIFVMKKAFLDLLYSKRVNTVHYIHNFFGVLKFIDSSDLDNSRFYSQLLGVQISPNEWNLIYYSALFRKDKDTYYLDLLEKHLDTEEIKKYLLFNSHIE